MQDPLGLAGKTREIGQVAPVERKKRSRVVCIRSSKEATIEENIAAVDKIFAAARAEKKRRDWDFVD